MLPAFPLCRAFFTNEAREFQAVTLLEACPSFSYLRIDVSLNTIIYLRQTRPARRSWTHSRSEAAKEARARAYDISRPIQLVYKLS